MVKEANIKKKIAMEVRGFVKFVERDSIDIANNIVIPNFLSSETHSDVWIEACAKLQEIRKELRAC